MIPIDTLHHITPTKAIDASAAAARMSNSVRAPSSRIVCE